MTFGPERLPAELVLYFQRCQSDLGVSVLLRLLTQHPQQRRRAAEWWQICFEDDLMRKPPLDETNIQETEIHVKTGKHKPRPSADS